MVHKIELEGKDYREEVGTFEFFIIKNLDREKIIKVNRRYNKIRRSYVDLILYFNHVSTEKYIYLFI